MWAGSNALFAAPGSPASVKGAKVLGYKQLKDAGWRINQPPYPYAAMRAHEQGTVYVQLATDASGRVVTATTAKKTTHPKLDAALCDWATSNWHGPPNTAVITFFIFRIP